MMNSWAMQMELPGLELVQLEVGADGGLLSRFAYRVVEDRFERCIGGEWVHVTKARSGFPKVCPAGREGMVCGRLCEGCEWYGSWRSAWRCEHEGYQQAPGEWFCRVCGTELSPYAAARGWHFCHGEQCLRGKDG